ncbi:hypothetical protein I4U23_002766, partial [Adineta vaga]
MTSDVEDLTTLYDNLPSIFEKNTSSVDEVSCDIVLTDNHTNKFYQPMFGSFLLTDSNPVSREAFVASSSPSTEVVATEEQTNTSTVEHTNSRRMQSSPPPLASMEDIDDDNEDDFDGIPIQHSSTIMNKKRNGDSDCLLNHTEQDYLLDELVHHIENSHDENDIEDDTYLNGFNDEEHDTTAVVPSLFKDIPDIDDPNLPEDDNDASGDNGQVPFDQMDMFDQSDSIRSSSPDSLLSSSHLQDEQDDDIDTDDEVAQWNDDLILHTTSSNINVQPQRINSPLVLNINPFDQVNFIDSSRSPSQCSNVSSQLSMGYADQARTFMSDDELETSSDSDADNNDRNDEDDDEHVMNFNCDTFERDDSEDICLKVNLDVHRSPSSTSRSNSTRSLSPIPDETSIVDIDEENNEEKILQVAPIAALDDEEDDVTAAATDDDDDDDGDNNNDLQMHRSNQPIFPTLTSNVKNLVELQFNIHQNELIHEIINMRHLLNENNQDDEFLAVMHNPKVFEEILYKHDDNTNKKSDLIKQANSVTSSTFQPSLQLLIDNKIEKESVEHLRTIHPRYSSLESNGEKNLVASSSSSSQYPRQTTILTPPVNNSSLTAVNHLTRGSNDDEQEREEEEEAKKDDTSETLYRKQQKQCLSFEQTNTSDIDVQQFVHQKKDYQMMDINIDSQEEEEEEDDDDDDDLELLKTLSQFHGIINPSQTTEENHSLSFKTPGNNKTQNLSDVLSYEIKDNGNETELWEKKVLNSQQIPSSSSCVIDTMIKVDAEQEEKPEKKNVIFYKNLNNDDGGN